MPSSPPSSLRHPQSLTTGHSGHFQNRLHFRFFSLGAVTAFLSRLLSLPFRFLKLLSARSFSLLPSMDSLFSDDDFFSTTEDPAVDQADTTDLSLFVRPLAVAEVFNWEDRLYLVPYRWWLGAKENCLEDSDEAEAVLYTSNLLSPDSDLAEEEINDSKLEVVFSLREERDASLLEEENKESCNVEDKKEGCSGTEDKSEGCSGTEDKREGCPNREYALLYEYMWLKALKWYNDRMVAQKSLRCSLTGEDTSWDFFPIQIRLSVLQQANSFLLKICLADNIHNYYRACKVFDRQSNMMHIWDFSGKISNLLKVDEIFPSVGDGWQADDTQILLEWQIFGLPAIDEDKERSQAPEKVEGIYGLGDLDDSLSKMDGELEGLKTMSSAISQSCVEQYKEVNLLGLRGLFNLGNTCFMNSAIQCLTHTEQLVDYFLADYKKDLNNCNPLGMKGELALSFGELLRRLWAPSCTPIAPNAFKSTLACFAPSFNGYNQHDSQEFLAFLLDGLHEDLNRVKIKPYIEAKDADDRPDEEVADEYWQNHLARNNSIIVDLFQGQYRSTLSCPMCKLVSITFDPFMYLSLPLPSTTMRTMTLTLVSTDGISHPTELTVTVPQCGRLKDLMLALSSACSLGNDESLLIAEVYNNRILQFLEEPSDSLALIRDNDCLVVYRMPKESENCSLIVYMHQHDEGGLVSKSWQLFGIPFVTRVSNISTGCQIHEEFFKLMAPLIRPTEGYNEDTAGNIGSEGADVEEPSTDFSDDSSSSNEEGERTSTLGANFKFCHVDPRCIWRGSKIKMNSPLSSSSTNEKIYVLVSWPTRMMRKYDTSCLSLLPEIFSPEEASAKRSKESVSLSRCVEAFLKEEPLGPDDMWYCPGCKKHQQAIKKLDLWRLPEVLVFQLKRFSYSRFHRSKLDTYVDFPTEELEMSEFIPCKNILTSYRYKLYAVSNHYGGMGGGHYTALVNYADDWYEFDDSRVTSISEAGVKTSAAYVLFYQRVPETASGSSTLPPSPSPLHLAPSRAETDEEDL